MRMKMIQFCASNYQQINEVNSLYTIKKKLFMIRQNLDRDLYDLLFTKIYTSIHTYTRLYIYEYCTKLLIYFKDSFKDKS